MSDENTKNDDEALLKEIRDFCDESIRADSHNRIAAAADLEFLIGEQWPEEIQRMRQLEKRPCLTFNRLPTFLHQVTNDQRQNKPGIKVHPVGSGADIKKSEIIQGLIRHIEYASNADIAYDTAVNSAAAIGDGYWQLITEYESPTSFDQVIKYRRIRDALKVYFDFASTEGDGSDAKKCAIIRDVPRAEFKRENPKADEDTATAMGLLGNQVQMGWMNENFVREVEYYYFEYTKTTLCLMHDGSVIPLDQVPEGVEPKDKRATQVPQLMWCKATAGAIIERTKVMCPWIPVFPVRGNETDIRGKVYRSGIIRAAKDPAQMYNFWMHQSLDTPVATPDGWSTIGALKVGDQVFSDTGEVSNVIGKSPVYIGKDCYRVTFGDGSEVISSAEHPWVVEERGKRTGHGFKWQQRKLRTDELDPAQHCIKAADPLQMPAADLDLDPYVLGVWLGDGSRGSGAVSSSRDDIQSMRETIAARGALAGAARSMETSPCFTIFGITPALRRLGVLNNKHIPAAYMRASVEQRLELLRGLMDTDGTVHHSSGSCMFTQADASFADQVRELIVSLGIRVGITRRPARVSMMANGSQIAGTGSTQIAFTPPAGMCVFNLPRKAAVQTRDRKRHARRAYHKIVNVERIDSVPVQCIGIDAPSHLYLCGHSMIPTHNTSATEEVSLRPKTPFIGAEGQFEGHENEWGQANSRTFAYLEYKPTSIGGQLAPPPQRSPMADVPVGMLQMAMHASDNIKAVTGLFDSSLGARGNATSGVQERSQQKQGDTANFHYTDNLNRSIRHCGRCIVAMIPHYYDARRVVRLMKDDGTIESAEVNVQHVDPLTQAVTEVLNDLTVGTYDVTVEAGPSYTTMREEAAEAMVAVAGNFPKLMEVAGDLVIESMDWPGADIIAARLKKTMPPELTQDDDDKGPPPLPPEIEQHIQQADQLIDQLQAELKDAQSGIDRAKVDAASREEVARINADSAARVAEINAGVLMDKEELITMRAELAHRQKSDQIDQSAAHDQAAAKQAAELAPEPRPAASQAAESAQPGPTDATSGS